MTVVGLAVACLATAVLVWLVLVYPRERVAGQRRDVELVLHGATDVDELAALLERERVVERAWLFAAYLRLLGADRRLRTGPVIVSPGMDVRALLCRLATGYGASRVRLTFPEGFNRFDVARRLDRYGVCRAQEFLAVSSDPKLLDERGVRAPTLEGYLFPDTYDLEVGMAAREVVDKMLSAFDSRVRALISDQSSGLRNLGDLEFGPHEALVLASIVEKEAVVAEERPVIAGVFLNRLRSASFLPRQRLQADPTVSYGCLAAPTVSDACRAFDGRAITRSMLDDTKNRYNTYRHAGLPPGPICNPGLSSLRAVLAPAVHDYLYFVARGRGRHSFSASLDAHNAAVSRYRDLE